MDWWGPGSAFLPTHASSVVASPTIASTSFVACRKSNFLVRREDTSEHCGQAADVDPICKSGARSWQSKSPRHVDGPGSQAGALQTTAQNNNKKRSKIVRHVSGNGLGPISWDQKSRTATSALLQTLDHTEMLARRPLKNVCKIRTFLRSIGLSHMAQQCLEKKTRNHSATTRPTLHRGEQRHANVGCVGRQKGISAVSNARCGQVSRACVVVHSGCATFRFFYTIETEIVQICCVLLRMLLSGRNASTWMSGNETVCVFRSPQQHGWKLSSHGGRAIGQNFVIHGVTEKSAPLMDSRRKDAEGRRRQVC